MIAYFASLNPAALLRACPGGIAQGLIWGIMALGVYMTYRMLGLADLTVDGSLATGGAVCIMLVLAGWNPQLALLISFFAGVIAGLVTGFLHTKLGIPDILAGILTQISLYSINLNIMGKANQAVNVNKVNFLFSSNAKNLPRTIVLACVVCGVLVVLLYLYLGTEHGSALRATGINGAMARAQGINTGSMKVIGLALSNGLVALAGGVLSQYQGFADINMGRGAIVIGLAAVIIGEVLGEAFLGKYLNFMMRLIFVVLGGVIYYVVYVFVLWLKFPADDMKLLTAVVVAIFLAIPYLQNASKNSFSRIAKENARLEKEGK
ncbi:MAG: ABC transporter permease [Candidatus Faecousia sp.]|nr:ABC transporter permease [Clostridiales bacterium]MCI6935340.1 ABC transporter permease [Clostridiales bacterium]MDD5882918.1 ABC transporter permease [Bacillota bacterium]MDY4598656.1 ABC transporter permease [Candidatus Faecousia sp.]